MTLRSLRDSLAPLALPALVAAVLLALPRETGFRFQGSREVVDEEGRQVRFTPGATRALYMAVGAGEYLLTTRRAAGLLTSRSPTNERLAGSSLLRRAMPTVKSMRLELRSSEGAAANLETLLQRRPDILVTWSRLVPRFTRVGVPAAGLGPVTSTDRLYDHARLYGALTNQQRRSASIGARSIAERTSIARDVSAQTSARTRVLFLYPSGVAWRTTFEFADVVAAAGGDDLGQRTGSWAALDAERLIAIAPDVIVIVGGEQVEDDAAMRLMADPVLASVPAIVQRRVYRRPPGVSGYMDSAVELPIYERWLAEVLHSDALAPSARSLAARIVRRELGAEPSDLELDDMLGVRPNRGSAFAARFARAAR